MYRVKKLIRSRPRFQMCNGASPDLNRSTVINYHSMLVPFHRFKILASLGEPILNGYLNIRSFIISQHYRKSFLIKTKWAEVLPVTGAPSED